MKSMWMPLQGSSSIPWPSASVRRNIRPMPRPTKVRGFSSVWARISPEATCTSCSSSFAMPERNRTLVADMPDFDSDGVRIHYYLEGPEDGPPTVLVHGFCSNFKVNWVGSRWVETLARAGRRVIGLDNRGHGKSEKPHDPDAYGPHMVEDVCNLIDHLGLDRVDYIGYSMGSQIGLRLLVAHPQRALRAVAGGIGMNVTTPWRAGEAIARRLRGDETEQSPAAAMFYNFAMAVPGNDLEALACCILARSAPLTED